MDTIIKHDGFDQLRRDLAPLVALTVEKVSSDVLDITLTIPSPAKFHTSPFASIGFDTRFHRRFVWTDSNRRVLPPSYAPTILTLDEWETDIRTRAERLLADAQRDPVAFFLNESVKDLR